MPGGTVWFGGARVRLDLSAEAVRTWPDGYIVTDPASEEDGHLPGQDGRWGYLTRVADGEPSQRQAT
jgi:hypothetical protein